MTTTHDEYARVAGMLAGLTVSIPIALIASDRIKQIEQGAATDATLAVLDAELGKKLAAVLRPEDHMQMSQAYEAYAEASFCLAMADRQIRLERTPGTGQLNQKRPDFVHHHAKGDIYFEVKALEIADPLNRHPAIALEALENAAELDGRARTPGVHFGNPQELSGPLPSASLAERLDTTIDKIFSNVKTGQIYFGPTVLVVDLGRFGTIPYGPSSLLPVFFHDGPPAESCVSGELWQVGTGQYGEQLFLLPEFDGKSNLAGHQSREGILRQFPGLMAITFVHPRWNQRPELLTLWNAGFDKSLLQNSCGLTEREICDLLDSYSDGLNDCRNEDGRPYRVSPLRPRAAQP